MSVSEKEVTESHRHMLDMIDEVVKAHERNLGLGTMIHRLEDAKAAWARLHVDFVLRMHNI